MQHRKPCASLLQRADIHINIHAPLASTLLRQTFANNSDDIIEAVYSFPLPRQSVIMQVIVTINDEVFVGQIKPARQAEERYEEGVENGQRSVLIRDLGDGLHELRAGNLAPQDRIEIEMKIAQLMLPQSGAYRYFLPTVIAPKYGHTASEAQISHQHSLLAHYPFKATLHLVDEAIVDCPSHSLIVKEGGYLFNGNLDEDIVLTVTSLRSAPFVLRALQGDYSCSLSVIPPHASGEPSPIVSLVVLIDCSGSMSGLSMQQTRAGLLECINTLMDGSEISLLCFGTNVLHANTQAIILSSESRESLQLFISNIDADMGGTEIWGAITAAQKQGRKHATPPEIVLLTDGQVWQNPGFFDELRSTQRELYRVHTVGVGSTVSDDVVINIASSTKGQWMLVHPNEPMSERLGQFIAQVSAPTKACLWNASSIAWSALPHSSTALYGAVGYTVYESNTKNLDIELNNMALPQYDVDAPFIDALQKLVGQQHIFALNTEEAESLSLKLGLVNQYTSFVMVSEHSLEAADGLPSLAVVPQMIPALNRSFLSAPQFLRRESASTCLEIDFHIDDDISFHADSMTSVIECHNASYPRDMVDTVLLNVEKKLNRALLKGKIPNLAILLKWGLEPKLVEAMEAYFTQHQVKTTQCYVAKILLWFNDWYKVLSIHSIDALQKSIDDSDSEDIQALDTFIEDINAEKYLFIELG